MIDETGIETGSGMCQGRLLSEGKGRWEIQKRPDRRWERDAAENASKMSVIRHLFYSTDRAFWEEGRDRRPQITLLCRKFHEKGIYIKVCGDRIG
jgi:hypothetical protein